MSGDGILSLYQWVVDSINYVCKTVIGCRKNQARLLCLVRVFTVGAITIEILLPVLWWSWSSSRSLSAPGTGRTRSCLPESDARTVSQLSWRSSRSLSAPGTGRTRSLLARVGCSVLGKAAGDGRRPNPWARAPPRSHVRIEYRKKNIGFSSGDSWEFRIGVFRCFLLSSKISILQL